MKILELTTEVILDGIEKTSGDLAIMQHQPGYYHIAVEVDGDEVVDYWLCESTSDYFRAENWHRICYVGTGSCACNCDACCDGDDPEDWAGEDGCYFEAYLEQCIEDFKSDLRDYLANL